MNICFEKFFRDKYWKKNRAKFLGKMRQKFAIFFFGKNRSTTIFFRSLTMYAVNWQWPFCNFSKANLQKNTFFVAWKLWTNFAPLPIEMCLNWSKWLDLNPASFPDYRPESTNSFKASIQNWHECLLSNFFFSTDPLFLTKLLCLYIHQCSAKNKTENHL